jgi:signal transduction histidine kinase
MDTTLTTSGPRPAPRRGLVVRDRRWLFDFAFGVVLAVVTVAPYVPSEELLTTTAGLGLVGAVVFRRTLPALAVVAAIGSALVFVYANDRGGAVIVVVPIMVYSAARWMRPGLGHVSLVAGLGGAVLGPLRWMGGGRLFSATTFAAYGAVVVACAGIVVGAYLIGRRRSDSVAVARQRETAEAERRRLVQAEEEQRALSASVSERQRIARELHDIVAHSLSVIVVQAEGGRALTAKHPERAPEVFGTIAEASREALVEMRRMVGLLRNENDDTGSRSPAPGLFDLPELVRRSGVDADFRVHGATPAVHPTLGLTAYRIVQESLTNVLKHAGPAARTTVRVDYRPDSIHLLVADDGRGTGAGGGRGGHGLTGMAERVGLHGGTLTAGPPPGPPGGFVVSAVLPMSPVRGRAGEGRVGP